MVAARGEGFDGNEVNMLDIFATSSIAACLTAFVLGMATILIAAAVIVLGQRRAVQRANARREAIIRDLLAK